MQPTIEQHLHSIASLCVKKVAFLPLETVTTKPVKDRDPLDKEPEKATTEVKDGEQESIEKSIRVSIVKAVDEEHTVTGVVLVPEVADGHGDIMSAKVVKETAFDFVAGINKTNKLGVQHTVFKKGQLELVESFIAPMSMVLGSKTVKAGSWVMTMRVLDMKLWKRIKDGLITGFSIGGIAKVIPLAA